MSEPEIERMKAGAKDLAKETEKMEQIIRNQVESELPHLSPEAKEAVIRSRVGVLNQTGQPSLIKADLGPDAGKNSKEDLFE